MAEKTVTVGDTDVEFRETEDGFEAVEVEDGFAEYVENIDEVSDANDLRDPAEFVGLFGSADLVVSYGFLTGNEMQALADDDGVEFAKSRGNEDGIHVGLRDVRDE